MAKMRKGIFGPISGKLGPVVGASWNDIPYLREAPKKKKKPAKRSEAQIANEQKMKFVNEVLLPFHPYITIGFQNEAEGKTALSVAYSANFHHAITGIYPNLGVDYSRITISKGNLPGLKNPSFSLSTGDTIALAWENSATSKAAYNDQLMLVLYSTALNIADGFIGGTLRRDLYCTFQFNPKLIGQVLEVYVSVTSLNRKRIADSIYLGRIIP